MEEIRIAMYGPSFGHNIIPFLEFFEQERKYQLLYIYRGKSSFPESYKNILFFRYAPRIIVIYKLYRKLNTSYKLIWFHRGFNPLTILIFSLLRRKSTVFNLNLYSERIPRLLLKNSLKSRIFIAVFKRLDYVQATWYGTYNLLKKTPLNNTVMLPWGLEERFYESLPENIKLLPFTSRFLENIPGGLFTFWYAKSIAPGSRHDLVILATKELVSKGIKDFIIFFWFGNNNNMALCRDYEQMLEEYDLQSYIRMVEHPLLPFEDYRAIYERIDCGLQIAVHDQFSSSLTEALAFKKEIIATRIEPYIILEEKFGLNLDLVSLDAHEIAARMQKHIKGYRTDPGEMNLRYDRMKKNYNFRINTEKSLEFFLGQPGSSGEQVSV